jgi:large subunit ribosomal protein L1
VGKRGKKYTEARAKVDRDKLYPLAEGVELVRTASFAGFDESCDIALRLGVNPKHSDQMVRGACILPHGTGKMVRVLVFAKGEKAKEAEDAGADIVGSDDLVEKIQGGFLDFDKTIATPDMMAKVGRLGRILGRRGLMPNPKLGTVTFEIANAVKEAKGGRIEFKVEKAGIIHACVGRKAFTAEQLNANIMALIETVIKLRPSTVKGTYLKSINISTTMGPGIKVDPVEVQGLFAK